MAAHDWKTVPEGTLFPVARKRLSNVEAPSDVIHEVGPHCIPHHALP